VAVETAGVVLDERRLPGRQGRLLFAYLATAGRPVPREQLADVLWGDALPTTWDKALSVLVSKLRGVLTEGGLDGGSALTAAFGCYQLDLPDGTWVDVLQAESSVREAESLLAANDLVKARDAAGFAESIVSLPFLSGDEGPWVEAKRRELGEVRVRALSVLAEASLRSGDAAEAVRWAEQEVTVEPFRESGYRRLMSAHIASGDRAEALRVYESCRALLAEELGAYPSPETESLYRGLLEKPPGGGPTETAHPTSPPGAAPPRAHRGRRPVLIALALVVLVAVVAAGTAIAVGASHGGGGQATSAGRTARVALVVPRSSPGSDDPSAQYLAAIARARNLYDIGTQTFEIDLSKPGLPERVRRSVGNFDLVLLAGQFVDTRFAHEIGRHPHTRFVVLDPDPNNADPIYSAVSRLPNATDVFFVEGPGAYLAGYLSALMAKRRAAGKSPIVVSLIAGDPQVNMNAIAGFSKGAANAVPGAKVLEDYSHDFAHPSVCAAIANRQIDHGSTAVFAAAGACSVGALSAAGVRGVWGVGADQDMSYVGPQMLVSTVKRLDRAVDYAIRSYLHGALPQGHLDIGIERNAVGIVSINPVVPAAIRAKLVRVEQQRIKLWTSWATPMR
jgi:basic membrane lipoprotein Med (substrate-binding protein (PBP1-ABC) superfamily)/DNA-binding SARP family transcriptional activator